MGHSPTNIKNDLIAVSFVTLGDFLFRFLTLA